MPFVVETAETNLPWRDEPREESYQMRNSPPKQGPSHRDNSSPKSTGYLSAHDNSDNASSDDSDGELVREPQVDTPQTNLYENTRAMGNQYIERHRLTSRNPEGYRRDRYSSSEEDDNDDEETNCADVLSQPKTSKSGSILERIQTVSVYSDEETTDDEDIDERERSFADDKETEPNRECSAKQGTIWF